MAAMLTSPPVPPVPAGYALSCSLNQKNNPHHPEEDTCPWGLVVPLSDERASWITCVKRTCHLLGRNGAVLSC